MHDLEFWLSDSFLEISLKEKDREIDDVKLWPAQASSACFLSCSMLSMHEAARHWARTIEEQAMYARAANPR